MSHSDSFPSDTDHALSSSFKDSLSEHASPQLRDRDLKKSRDAWKERATSYRDEMRYLRVKINDLTKSRTRWKQRALKAEASLASSQRDIESAAHDTPDTLKKN